MISLLWKQSFLIDFLDFMRAEHRWNGVFLNGEMGKKEMGRAYWGVVEKQKSGKEEVH